MTRVQRLTLRYRLARRFAKMVNNGIEYGLMAAYAEGLAVCAEPAKKVIIESKECASEPSESGQGSAL